jgi:D-glycero-D-manno-heptose 1,7-bisphosphate phosphatase
MRILIHGASLGPGAERMRAAAAGLVLRGHDVVWLGANVPAELAGSGCLRLHGGHPVRLREQAEIVLGGGARPHGTAASGWLAGAHAMVLGIATGQASGWGWLDRWGWGSLDSCAILEPGPIDGAPAPQWIDPDRVAWWSPEPAPEAPAAAHPDTEVLERACERWVARRYGHAPRCGVFVDRDGTLVVEKGYLSRAEDLELLDGAAGALARLRAAGCALVVVSNQSGVGRGFFPLEGVHQAMARMRVLLRERGVEIDAVYFCPHRPEAGCECRKPGTGMLRAAADNLNLSLRRSVMVGDKLLDVETGHAAGGLGVLVRTGYGRDEAARADSLPRAPDRVVADLAEAADWIARRAAED